MEKDEQMGDSPTDEKAPAFTASMTLRHAVDDDHIVNDDADARIEPARTSMKSQQPLQRNYIMREQNFSLYIIYIYIYTDINTHPF